MGLWWKDINTGIPETGVVRFEGHPHALDKKYPIVWRYGQVWHILMVGEPYLPRLGYRVMFSGGLQQMRCRKRLYTQWVAVRVGPKPVAFWAEMKVMGRPPSEWPLPLVDTEAARPCRLSMTEVSSKQSRQFEAVMRGNRRDITFI